MTRYKVNKIDPDKADTFCYYCQRGFSTWYKFIQHLRARHYHTYAYFSHVTNEKMLLEDKEKYGRTSRETNGSRDQI